MTILNSYTKSMSEDWVYLIVALLGLVFFTVITIKFYIDHSGWVIIAPILFAVISLTGVAIQLKDMISEYKNPTIYYEVVLDDNVTYNDFIKEYELVETNGQILTVVKRDAGSGEN